MNTLGEKIKYLRKQKDITQGKLAELINSTRPAVAKWETNAAFPPPEMIKSIADYFGVSTDYLLGRTLIPYIEIEIDGVETLEDARELGKKIGEEIAARSIPINTTCRIVGGRRKFLLFYPRKQKRTGD